MSARKSATTMLHGHEAKRYLGFVRADMLVVALAGFVVLTHQGAASPSSAHQLSQINPPPPSPVATLDQHAAGEAFALCPLDIHDAVSLLSQQLSDQSSVRRQHLPGEGAQLADVCR